VYYYWYLYKVFFLFKLHAFVLSIPLCIAILSITVYNLGIITFSYIICYTEGPMGQDPGNEILAAKGVFHLEQASQVLHFMDATGILVCSS
jgi:hypothetical protein